MRSKHFLAFAAITVAAALVGCGGDDSGTGGSAATSTSVTSSDTTTTTSDTTTSTSDVTTTTSTGPVDDGNNSFETAEVLDLNSGLLGELDTPDLDVDYYKVTGTKGMPLAFLTDAKPNDDPFADGYLDLVITIYDSNKQQIAQNDDPFPRTTQDSSVYTVLPADGDYYIKVEDFCESDLAQGGCPADYFDNIFEYGYAVNVFQVDGVDDMGNPFFPSFTAHGEPANEDLASATPLLYTAVDAADPTQGYYGTLALGAFGVDGAGDPTDVDYYVVDFPDGLESLFDPSLDFISNVSVYPGGITGSGSTASIGLITLWDDTGTNIIAQLDASYPDANNFPPDMTPPVAMGKSYVLTVENHNAAGGAHDFYFFNHNATQYLNPPEAETANENDTVPELLTPQDNADGSTSFFTAGTLTEGMDDVDLFSFDVAAGQLITASCGAQRSGSGLRNFTMQILDGSLNPVPASSVMEDVATDATLSDFSPPAAGTYTLQLKAGQDSTVTSNFYRCGINVHN